MTYCVVEDLLTDYEHELLQWLNERLDSRKRGITSVRLAELVNRKGRFRAQSRLRANAVMDLTEFLFAHGLGTQPDYREIDASPGIRARVTVFRLPEPSGGNGTNPRPQSSRADRHQSVDLMARLGMAVATADQQLAAEETDMIRRHAKRRLEALGCGGYGSLLASIDKLRGGGVDVDGAVKRLVQFLSRDEQRKLLEHLFDVAVADGVFVPEEEELLRRLYSRLDVEQEHFDRLMRFCKATTKPRAAATRATEPARRSTTSRRRRNKASDSVTVQKFDATEAEPNESFDDITQRPRPTGNEGCSTPRRIAALYRMLSGSPD